MQLSELNIHPSGFVTSFPSVDLKLAAVDGDKAYSPIDRLAEIRVRVEDFLVWNDQQKVSGKTAHCRLCPFANYFISATPAQRSAMGVTLPDVAMVEVGNEHVSFIAKGFDHRIPDLNLIQLFRLPEWVSTTIRKIDFSAPADTDVAAFTVKQMCGVSDAA